MDTTRVVFLLLCPGSVELEIGSGEMFSRIQDPQHPNGDGSSLLLPTVNANQGVWATPSVFACGYGCHYGPRRARRTPSSWSCLERGDGIRELSAAGQLGSVGQREVPQHPKLKVLDFAACFSPGGGRFRPM